MALMDQRQIGKQDLDGLRAQLRGAVLCPADEGYATAREIHNGMIEKRPAIIARCSGVADVMRALEFGTDKGCRSPFGPVAIVCLDLPSVTVV